ncbi:MAG: helicase HerA domain-containing protein [Caldisericia bacterium]
MFSFLKKKKITKIYKTPSNIEPVANIYESKTNLHYVLYKEDYSTWHIYYFVLSDTINKYVQFVFVILKNPIENSPLNQYNFKNSLNEDVFVLELYNDESIISELDVVSLENHERIYETLKSLKIAETIEDNKIAEFVSSLYKSKALKFNSINEYKTYQIETPTQETIEPNIKKEEKPIEEKTKSVEKEREVEEKFSFEKLKEELNKEEESLQITTPEKIVSFVGFKFDKTGEKYEIKNSKPVQVFLNGDTAIKQLSTHTLITGKTGSGKTSFNLLLIDFLLRNDVSVIAFDVKEQSIDYSSYIIKSAEKSSDIAKYMNEKQNGKERGIISKEQIPQKSSLKDNNKTLTGKEIVPIIIWNKDLELGEKNIKYLTKINILGTDFLDRLASTENIEERKAIIKNYKDYLENIFLNYISLINHHNKISSQDVAMKLVEEVMNFNEKTNYEYEPSSKDFNIMFENSVRSIGEKVNEVYIKRLIDENKLQNYIDIDSGVNLYKMIRDILSNKKIFYMVLNINPSLSAFYFFYIHYILSEPEIIQLAEMKSGLRFAIFVDEAEYLTENTDIAQQMLIAEQVDRSKGIGLVLSSQQVFKKDFSAQSSIGNNILFSPQSSDLTSIKSKFSNIKNIQKVAKSPFIFVTDSDVLFVDSNNNIIRDTIIATIPNFVYSSSLQDYGVQAYLNNAARYFVTSNPSSLEKIIPVISISGETQIKAEDFQKQIIKFKKYIKGKNITDADLNYIIGILISYATQNSDNKLLSQMMLIKNEDMKDKISSISKILNTLDFNI